MTDEIEDQIAAAMEEEIDAEMARWTVTVDADFPAWQAWAKSEGREQTRDAILAHMREDVRFEVREGAALMLAIREM